MTFSLRTTGGREKNSSPALLLPPHLRVIGGELNPQVTKVPVAVALTLAPRHGHRQAGTRTGASELISAIRHVEVISTPALAWPADRT